RARLRQLPLRLRVAAAFAVAMAIVLAGAGLLIYARLGADLSQALDRDLRLRAQDLAALVRQPGASLASDSASSLIERGESSAQPARGPADRGAARVAACDGARLSARGRRPARCRVDAQARGGDLALEPRRAAPGAGQRR